MPKINSLRFLRPNSLRRGDYPFLNLIHCEAAKFLTFLNWFATKWWKIHLFNPIRRVMMIFKTFLRNSPRSGETCLLFLTYSAEKMGFTNSFLTEFVYKEGYWKGLKIKSVKRVKKVLKGLKRVIFFRRFAAKRVKKS